jgi:hypothetical protein
LSPTEPKKFATNANGHFYESVVFVEAVKTKNQSLIRSDYADAVKTLAATLAALESAEKNGEPIEVPKVDLG